MQSILYDGWSLIYHPNSPTAIHLLTLLELHPAELEALVALPADAPDGLPSHATTRVVPAANTPGGRLGWEQRILPHLVQETKAKALHLTSPTPPLAGVKRCLISPAGFDPPFLLKREGQQYGIASRLRESLAAGGLERTQGILWPADLPMPSEAKTPPLKLPPVVHPAFSSNLIVSGQETYGLELPDSYVLYHGPTGEGELRFLLEAWSWPAGSHGATTPLVMAGVEHSDRLLLDSLLAEYELAGTVRLLPRLSMRQLLWVYQHCAALFHPAQIAAWGDPVRHALACTRPIVAIETPASNALVGPAAYLVPPQARSLGAALISVLVEESLAERLVQAASKRAAAWDKTAFTQALARIYLTA